MYCRSGLKRKLLAPGGLQYQDVGWAQCSFLWASFVTPLGPAYTAVFRTKCLCKAGRWHFPEPHTLGADEFTIYPCIFLCAKISVFSVETAFSEWEHFLKKGHFWFSAWFVGVPETVRSDTEMLARPKLLYKSNVSSNARCFVKRLHRWSSFLVGIWDAVHPCSSNCLFDSTLFILSMDARWSQLYSKIIRAPQGVWTARCQQWIKACFTQPIQIVRFEPVGPGFRSPLMLDGSIDTKIMVITETCWLNTNWCLDASPVFDFVDWLTSAQAVSIPLLPLKLGLQHSGKGLSQLSCPRHDLPEKGIFHAQGHFTSGKAENSVFLDRDRNFST